MNRTIEHQKLVDDLLFAVGSLPNVRVWPRTVGTFLTLHGKRVVSIGPVGGADITGIIRPWGTRLCLEIKTGEGQLNSDQKKFRDMILNFGGIYIEARSVEQVLAELKKYT